MIDGLFYLIIGIFYLTGEPISLYLHRYRVLAVKDHSFAPCASHLQQFRLVNYQIVDMDNL